MSAAIATLVFCGNRSLADDLAFETVRLPPLRIHGQAARAHTQGLELVAGQYFVTARREDVRPKRSLLLRTELTSTNWDVWGITPVDAQAVVSVLDHPGGMQSDGTRLWIPLAESRRGGRSLIRAYPISGLVPGRQLKAELEFPVSDHIGAVAVDQARRVVYGASWDTESVYVWNFDGSPQRTLGGAELESRGLGVVKGDNGRSGLAVQDWKMVGDRLFASGLFRGPGIALGSPQSRLLCFADFAEPGFQRWSLLQPKQTGVELAHEAMAIFDGAVYFLPEDLGALNRMFRVSQADLIKPSVLQDSRTRGKELLR